MNYIKRSIEDKIKSNLFKGKIIIIYGPRQVGKTTMVQEILKDFDRVDVEYYTCDDPNIRSRLINKNTKELADFLLGKKLIVIDEAQMVTDIGVTLKLMHDTYPDVQIIATGSSSFDLANKTKEPLTGRSLEYILLPLSLKEISASIGNIGAESMINIINIYGSYPDILFGNIDRREALINISSQYLYKDLLKFEGIRKPELLEKLLKLIATNVGSEVSYTEMSNTLDVHKSTVETYISYLEQAFIIYKVLPYSNNIRSQISKKRKIYFFDNGMRNAVLGNFEDLENRVDKGALWENFVFSDFYKMLLVKTLGVGRMYFLRTYDKQEIDMIIQNGSEIDGYEIKYKNQKIKIPKVWKDNFKNKDLNKIKDLNLISRENYLDFVI